MDLELLAIHSKTFPLNFPINLGVSRPSLFGTFFYGTFCKDLDYFLKVLYQQLQTEDPSE